MFRILPALFLLENLITVRSYINIPEKNAVVKNSLLKFLDPPSDHTHDVKAGEYSYVVSIVIIEQETITKHCTGSIISPLWVLSASNCYYDVLERNFFVWYGNFTITPIKTKLYTKVQKIFIHPSFLKTDFTRPGYFFGDYDISLLRIRKVEIYSFGRISAIDYTKMAGLPVTYVGSGTKNKQLDGKYGVQTLQVAEGIVIKCGLTLTMWSQYIQCVTPKCSEKSHQPVHGDSGGPFVYDGKIIGVMSVGYQIPKSFVTSNGLTPISPYKDWIDHVTTTANLKKKTIS